MFGRTRPPAPPPGVDINDVWWRAEIRHYSVADEWGDHCYTTTDLVWTHYVVERATPKGVWLRGFMTGRIFVLGTAAKQQACPTPELALADAIARKKRHVRGCLARLSLAESDLETLEHMLKALRHYLNSKET